MWAVRSGGCGVVAGFIGAGGIDRWGGGGGRDGAARSKMDDEAVRGTGEMDDDEPRRERRKKHDGIGSKLEGDERVWAVVGRPLVLAFFDWIACTISSVTP